MLKLKSVSRNINNNFCSEPHNTITPPSPIYQYLYKIFLQIHPHILVLNVLFHDDGNPVSQYQTSVMPLFMKTQTTNLQMMSQLYIYKSSISVLPNVTIPYCWNDCNYPSYWEYWHTGVDMLDELWHMRWGFSCWSYMGLLSSDELHRYTQQICFVANL